MAAVAGVHMYLTLLSEGMSFTIYNIITPWGAMPVHSTEKAPTVGLLDNGEKALTEDAQKGCVRKGFLVATSGDELVYVTQLHSGCIERRKGMEEEFSCAESDGKDGTIPRLLIWPSANYTSASIFETRGDHPLPHGKAFAPLQVAAAGHPPIASAFPLRSEYEDAEEPHLLLSQMAKSSSEGLWDFFSHGEDNEKFVGILRKHMQYLGYRHLPIFRGRKT